MSSVTLVAKSKLPTPWGTFTLVGFQETGTGKDHAALVMGDITGEEPVLGRIHSECLTGDALFSLRCDCGFQLQAAMENIAKAGRGVLLYVRQEGRGIGLLNKIRLSPAGSGGRYRGSQRGPWFRGRYARLHHLRRYAQAA